jgi:hypothetical protein
MLHNDFDPVTVMDFDPDALSMFIRVSAGGMQKSEVDDKTQIQYLHKYLSNMQHTRAKTMVIESHYIDRHYLEDFSEYYARCFNEYPKSCSRIHFFSCEFDHPEFIEKLAIEDEGFEKDLNEAYLGNVVIRPIPHTFLGKSCLLPYKELLTNPSYKLIRRKTKVSLFGLDIEVQTAPFLEKDEVVAKCATSAIWALLSTSKEVSENPSLSSITRSTGAVPEGGRIFPTESLTPIQITTGLSKFGFESIVHHLSDKSAVQDTKELSFAYISNDIPLLIGGTVFRKEDGVMKPEGDHLVCALGFRVGSNNNSENELNLTGRDVDRIYVHDDRYGPYLSWKEDQIDVPFLDASGEEILKNITVWKYGLKDKADSIINDREEYFFPDIVICGMNHKIRIPYSEILNSCEALTRYVKADMLSMKLEIEVDAVQEIVSSIRAALDCRWSIYLASSSKYKSELRRSTEFKFFNGAAGKNALLLKSLPKHLWICRLKDAEELFMDILFDATEVPQGNTLIGVVIYSEAADTMMRAVEVSIRQRNWAKYEATEEDKVNVRPFVTFFDEVPDRQLLNTQYGQLRTPNRGLSEFEQDETSNVTQADAWTISAHSGNISWDTKLDKSKKQIWVVDVSGNLVIGIEDKNVKHGHPTLIDGRPARLGGQLKFDEPSGKWVVDLFSGAYSGHLKKPSEIANAFLDNVKNNLLKGLNVEVNYG